MVRRDLSAMASLGLLFVCGMLGVARVAHAQSATPGGMPKALVFLG